MNRRQFFLASTTALVGPGMAFAEPCASDLVDRINERLNNLGSKLSADALKRGVVAGGVTAGAMVVLGASAAVAVPVVVAGVAVGTAAPVIKRSINRGVELLNAAFDAAANEE